MPSPRFKPGTPKPANSGRKKGVPNKRTRELVAAVSDTCAKHGVDPIEGMCILSKTTDDDSIRFQCYKELAGYMYAKMRAPVQLTSPDGAPLELNHSARDAHGLECQKAVESFIDEIGQKPK